MKLPDDWVAVPRTLTPQMNDALQEWAQCEGYIEQGYDAMLKAAPKLVLYSKPEVDGELAEAKNLLAHAADLLFDLWDPKAHGDLEMTYLRVRAGIHTFLITNDGRN